MTKIIIGSTAIKHWREDFRTPKDVDIASSKWIDGKDCIVLSEDILKLIPSEDGYATLHKVVPQQETVTVYK